MKSDEFVEVVRAVVLESSVKSVDSLLRQPPGRKPKPELVELAKWFSGLSEEHHTKVIDVARLAAHQAVFGLLAVIDGARAIESSPVKGRLELKYVSQTGSRILNDPNGPQLHDLLNQKGDPRGSGFQF